MDTNDLEDSVSYAPDMRFGSETGVLSREPLMSVYCSCGRIVILDRSEMQLKLSLGKDLQCTKCRNERISRDIDMLNGIFDGTVTEDAEAAL